MPCDKFTSVIYLNFLRSFFSDLSFLKNKRVLLSSVGTLMYEIVFIVSYLNIIINKISPSLFWVGVMFVIKRFVRIAFDIPIGIWVDRFLGTKRAVMIAFFLKIAFVFFLIFPNIYVLMLSSFFEGLSLSFFRGKVSVFHYAIFETEKIEDRYVSFSSFYGLFVGILTNVTAFIAIFFWRWGGVELTVLMSILMLIFGVLLVHFSVSSKLIIQKYTVGNQLHLNDFFSKVLNYRFALFFDKIYDKIKKLKSIFSVKIDFNVLGMGVVMGLCLLGWQINTINQFFAMNIGSYSEEESVAIFRLGFLVITTGSFLSLINKFREVRFFLKFIVFVIFINSFLPLLLPPKYAVFGVFSYLLVFVPCENVIRQAILNSTPKCSRSFIMSIATTLSSVFSMLSFFILHFANTLGYRVSYSLIFAVLSLMGFVGLFFVYYVKGDISNVLNRINKVS